MSKIVILFFAVLVISLTIAAPAGETETSSITPEDAEIECRSTCKRTREYKPLCGKDGNTYPNESSLTCRNECAKKQGKPEVEVAHEGKCPTDRPVTIPKV